MGFIDFKLDEGNVINNYNFSENYIKNLNNISLDIFFKFKLNGKSIVSNIISKFSKKVNFFNLRLLNKKNLQNKTYAKEDLSWYLEEKSNIINTYICFLIFNKKLINNLNNLNFLFDKPLNSNYTTEFETEMELVFSKIFFKDDKINVFEIITMDSMNSNFVFPIIL